MLDFHTRLNGLRAALSAKFAQDDLIVVDTFDLPTDDPEFLAKLVEERNWGPAVLFVDDTDIMPLNITAATDKFNHMNLMPVYGKHCTTPKYQIGTSFFYLFSRFERVQHAETSDARLDPCGGGADRGATPLPSAQQQRPGIDQKVPSISILSVPRLFL